METPFLQTPTLLYLSKSDITQLVGNSSQLYLDAVYHALTLHARGEIVQPLKPYLRLGGDESHIADRIIDAHRISPCLPTSRLPARLGHTRELSL